LFVVLLASVTPRIRQTLKVGSVVLSGQHGHTLVAHLVCQNTPNLVNVIVLAQASTQWIVPL
jgi:hypothetical protein